MVDHDCRDYSRVCAQVVLHVVVCIWTINFDLASLHVPVVFWTISLLVPVVLLIHSVVFFCSEHNLFFSVANISEIENM